MKFFLIAFLVVLASGFSKAQDQYQIKFTNGEEHTITVVDENPGNIPNGNFAFSFFKFGIIEAGAVGPFSLDLKYQRLLDKNKSVIEGNFCFLPIDSRYLEMSPEDQRKFNISGELTYKRYFFKDILHAIKDSTLSPMRLTIPFTGQNCR
jgi:hypothetical protein